jgi:carbon-monoxide dehydrogenase large subunit
MADLEVESGSVRVRGVPEKSLSYAQVIARSRAGNLLGRGTFTNTAEPDPISGQPGAATHYHQAVCAAQVAVDIRTGHVEVLDLQPATFAGVMINPTLCELQLEGTAVMGLGQALFEEVVCENGAMVNPSLADYIIPAIRDVPYRIGTVLAEDIERNEVHGIGENAQPAIAPAIANAITDAVRVRVYDLPITPEKVLTALRNSMQV